MSSWVDEQAPYGGSIARLRGRWDQAWFNGADFGPPESRQLVEELGIVAYVDYDEVEDFDDVAPPRVILRDTAAWDGDLDPVRLIFDERGGRWLHPGEEPVIHSRGSRAFREADLDSATADETPAL